MNPISALAASRFAGNARFSKAIQESDGPSIEEVKRLLKNEGKYYLEVAAEDRSGDILILTNRDLANHQANHGNHGGLGFERGNPAASSNSRAIPVLRGFIPGDVANALIQN